MNLRVGTRGSRLARTQTDGVVARLQELGHEVEVVVIQTLGDRDKDSPYEAIGAPGVFVREIERALLDGDIDLAVHSYKDLPSVHPDGLVVAAVPERLDPADVLLVRPDVFDPDADWLPVGAGRTVGTSAARRRSLLASRRPDLRTATLRGNVDTRIRKLAAEEYDAIVLATAGLERLARDADNVPDCLSDLRRYRLDPTWFVPAPAQGALALQVRDDGDAVEAVAPLHRDPVARALSCERGLLARVEGSCELPFGAWCRETESGGLELYCALGEGERLEVQHLRGGSPRELADRAWEGFVQRGVASA